MTRSDPDISAIFARTSLSPSASPERARLRSSTVSFIAARSSSVSRLDTLPLVLRADFLVLLMTAFLVCASRWTWLMLRTAPPSGLLNSRFVW